MRLMRPCTRRRLRCRDIWLEDRRGSFGLTAHLRKSATSVASNIAEGCGRDGEKELCRFFSIAAGSASELEYQLLLAHDLQYLSRDAYVALNEQVAEVKRMLYRFMQSLNSTS